MPQCLISVTNIEEATIALENGADIIDLKDPNSGALGALPILKIQEITTFINHQKLVSATIGDLPMQAEMLTEAVKKLMEMDVDFIKIGFFESQNIQACLTALAPLITLGAKLIAVLFAEKQYSQTLLLEIKAAGFTGIMLDTSEKNGATLFDYYSMAEREAFCQFVLHQRLSLGLAGSLNVTHIQRLKTLKPSYIGFRGGVCDDDHRTNRLNATKVREVCKLL